ncbi:MAG: adenylate/guanylate cyclase domain-containing protein [Betaproteobacteria bacterium]|nr:adenylate/guanylate cyclase domain-containing protein [Betaproteobacteria bacterium]
MEASPDVNVFLFTDIEGSTSAWEKEHDRMAQAVALHDAMLRNEIESRGGRVIKTTGDGVYAMFADPLEAVQAVLAFQLALADPVNTGGMPIRVRCGLHAGVAVERDGDYFGTTINRTARIMGVGHGGQVLLSASVVDLVRDSLPPELSLRELGAVRLKDLAAPEQVSQLVHPGLAHEFPPLRSLEALPNNLPQQLTSFVGRERELVEAKALLGKTRLLTLLGMGGLGKTRLSLQIGADLLDEFPDGVWFVDLAPITDASLVPNEAAQVLGVREEPGKPILLTLTAHLKSRKLLVIVDNCEHLMDACANFANTVLRAVREVRIIATSREALRVPGEQTYPVFPLPVPERDASVESLSRSDAVQLFVERAQAQKPSFALTEKDAPAIAELVARLEGIPLALELAAARIRALSLQDINKRLQNRFALLTGGGRVLMERQQTLRALVAWSYDLLTDHEQLLFDRLSVFAGGFDLAAAEAVSGVEPLMPEDVLDLVASLVDKSLVMVQEADDEMRYRMLETIREYAGEGLVKRDEQAAAVVRHCEHYLGVAKAARDQLKGPEQAPGHAPAGARPRQPARGHRTLGRGRRRPGDRRQDRSGADALLDPARLRDRGPQQRPLGAGAAGSAGGAGRQRARALRRRHAGREPERLRRGAPDAGRLPRAAARARQSARDRGDTLDAGGDPPERRRRHRGASERGRGAGHLPRAQGSHRRRHRPPAPG